MNNGAIRIRTDMPDISDAVIERYDWSKTVYAGSEEEFHMTFQNQKVNQTLCTTFLMGRLA